MLGLMAGLAACQGAAGNESPPEAPRPDSGLAASPDSRAEGAEKQDAGRTSRQERRSSSAQIDPALLKAELGKELQLPIHRVAVIAGEDLSLTFEEVLEDSRCPEGADCVWAGKAIIRLTAEKDGEGRSVQLELPGGAPDPNGTRTGAYLLRFIHLAPYPQADQKIPPTDYVATLLVKKPERE